MITPEDRRITRTDAEHRRNGPWHFIAQDIEAGYVVITVCGKKLKAPWTAYAKFFTEDGRCKDCEETR